MAILSKIRDRSMFLILIVGLALFAFVLDPSSIQEFFSSSKTNVIGEVNGETIDREEFAKEVENYKSQNGANITQMQAVNAVWNTMVSDKIFKYQLEEAGIVVGEKDIWDAMTQLPEIQNSQIFKNEVGFFDAEKLKEYIANIKAEAEAGNTQAWLNWLESEKQIKQNLERQAYISLVSAGLGASLEEGKREYFFNNTQMDAQFVYVPYTSISDSIVKLSKKEIQNYVEDNSKKYKSVATRSLQYVKIDIVPSVSDEEDAKKEVESYIEDREEYSNAAKANVKIAGLKNTEKYEAFLSNNNSDLSMDNGYYYKNQITAAISEDVFNANVGDVFGPYKDKGFYKISKIVDFIQIPDSVKSSHILVPFTGAVRSNSIKSEEEAKKTADSIYALVKNNKAKFNEIADEINTDGTKGKGGSIGWVRKNQAFSPSFDKDFANFIYKNNAGSVAVVKTAFGFHIIRIDEQTKAQKAVKLATFAREIHPSEETENAIFEKAETLAANLEEGKNLDELAKENAVEIKSAVNLKELDENIPGLGNQRQIVNWAFNKDNKLNASKRFDIDVAGKRSYVVVVITGKTEKDGVAISSEMLTQIRPVLINKKKATLIKEKLKGTNLEEVAKNAGVNIQAASMISLSSPLIPGVGNEPAVVGAMSTMEIEKISAPVEGDKGVFVLKVTSRTEPTELDNYDIFRNKIVNSLKNRSFQVYQMLEDKSEIKDYRAKFY